MIDSIKNSFGSERGVSPVVGVIMIILITVFVVAIGSTFVIDIIDQNQKQDPSYVDVHVQEDPDTGELIIDVDRTTDGSSNITLQAGSNSVTIPAEVGRERVKLKRSSGDNIDVIVDNGDTATRVNTLTASSEGSENIWVGNEEIKSEEITIKELDYTFEDHSANVVKVIQLSDGRIASASADETVRIWNPDGTVDTTFEGHSGTVNDIIQLDDGQIASASNDDTIKIWNPDTGNVELTYTGHPGNVLSLAQSDGRIASESLGDTIDIWNRDTGSFEKDFIEHTYYVNDIISIGNGGFASASADETVRIWNPNFDNKVYTVFNGHSGHFVNSVTQLEDGRYASASADETVQIWSPGTDKDDNTVDTTFEGHSDTVFDAIQLSDGRIASASRDDTIKIWNPDTGNVDITIEKHSNDVNSVTQLSDGRIASASDDGTVKIWDIGA